MSIPKAVWLMFRLKDGIPWYHWRNCYVYATYAGFGLLAGYLIGHIFNLLLGG